MSSWFLSTPLSITATVIHELPSVIFQAGSILISIPAVPPLWPEFFK